MKEGRKAAPFFFGLRSGLALALAYVRAYVTFGLWVSDFVLTGQDRTGQPERTA